MMVVVLTAGVIVRPSRPTRSVSETSMPCSAARPFTLTRPAAMASSAPRRDSSVAAAMYLFKSMTRILTFFDDSLKYLAENYVFGIALIVARQTLMGFSTLAPRQSLVLLLLHPTKQVS